MIPCHFWHSRASRDLVLRSEDAIWVKSITDLEPLNSRHDLKCRRRDVRKFKDIFRTFCMTTWKLFFNLETQVLILGNSLLPCTKNTFNISIVYSRVCGISLEIPVNVNYIIRCQASFLHPGDFQSMLIQV